MKRCCARFALAWLVSIGVGCTSAPVRYYTLTPPPNETLPVSKLSVAIDVRVHTLPQLKHSELIIRTGPTQVTLLDNERWASPVSDEFQGALRLALQQRLGSRPALPQHYAKLTLDVDVQHLEAELGRYALLEATWTAILSSGDPAAPAGARTTACAFHAKEKIQSGYAGIVEGYQREIQALAEAIVAALSSPASGVDAPCPISIENH